MTQTRMHVLFGALELLSKVQHRELQNGWSWKGSLEIIWSTPLLKQLHLSKFSRISSRYVLNISGEGDFITSLGSVFQGSVTFTDDIAFPHSKMEFPVFQLNLSLRFSAPGHH